MKTEWDYTDLAKGYLKRPDYADQAIDEIISKAGIGIGFGARVCDVGAGVGHLTLMLADRGLDVTAVEPNDAMRSLGQERTADRKNIQWFEGVGEDTGQPDQVFDLVTFGSSFNVTDHTRSLKETSRILKPNAWCAMMWNHRDLTDPVQAEIEKIIQGHIPNYNYGSRREDQSSVISASGLFGPVNQFERSVVHYQNVDDVIEAWRSHGTLHRQAGDQFQNIISRIETLLHNEATDSLAIPYTTRVWMAQLKPDA